MLQRCTIFRLFSVLVFLVLGNIVFFRSYFHSRSDPYWTSSTFVGFDIGHTIWGNATPSNTTPGDHALSRGRATTLVVSGEKSLASNSTPPGNTSQTSEPLGVLRAYGKIVEPRANVSTPWEQRNVSTLCPLVPPFLIGRLKTSPKAPNLTEVVRLNPGLEPGGHFQPSICKARHRVAIIVPYRDRETHLHVLLHNLHPMLRRQQLDYFVLVVEQAKPTTFNRGMLLNIGAVEALGLWDVQCFIFHDVDLVPEDDRNLYSCPEHPRHMSAAVDKFGYRLPYDSLLGGVTALSVTDFHKLNGYSNMFYGWGGEDDDLSRRVSLKGLNITRYRMAVARYRMLAHTRDRHNQVNPKRFELLSTSQKRQPTDGLNSLEYQVQKVEFRPAYTWILVTIDQQKIVQKDTTVRPSS